MMMIRLLLWVGMAFLGQDTHGLMTGKNSVFSTSLQVCYAPGQRLCCCHQLVFRVLENFICIHVAGVQALSSFHIV